MNNRLEALNCPNCGATIDYLSSNTPDFQCEYCGSLIHLNTGLHNTNNVSIADEFWHVAPDQVIQRAGRLFYLGKYEQAKVLLEKSLVYYPNNAKLLELENQCEIFLTRNIGNYIRMLSVRTFLTSDESTRFKVEIDGFCRMVGNKAINSLNTPMQRKQNTESYEAILKYIIDLKKCLRNDAVIHNQELYESVRMAVLKLSAIVCNTIYIKNTRLPRQYIMLIDFKYRQQLKAEFDAIDSLGETGYKIVDENVIRHFIHGGRYE